MNGPDLTADNDERGGQRPAAEEEENGQPLQRRKNAETGDAQMEERSSSPAASGQQRQQPATLPSAGASSRTTEADQQQNMLQAVIRMAFAAFMTLWLIASRVAFLIPPRAIVSSTSKSPKAMDRGNKSAEREETSGGRRRRKRHSLSPSSSSSSSSSDKGEEEGERQEVAEGSKRTSLKIDSKLLHTDRMPEEAVEEEAEKLSLGSVPESPPIQIETVGVQKDHIREQMAQEQGEGPRMPPPFLFFPPMGAGMPSGQGEQEEEEEEEELEDQQQSFGRLDAIVEEDSDELRSAQSSRASTARAQSSAAQQQTPAAHSPGGRPPHPPPPPAFILLQRKQSAGSSSQSSGPKVVELSTPEEEEEDLQQFSLKRHDSAEAESSAAGGSETPKVPRLELLDIGTPEGSEPEDREQREEEEDKYSSGPSETDTVLVLDEGQQQKQEKERTELEREHKEKMSSFPAVDADRDNSELEETMSDQQIAVPVVGPAETPMEDLSLLRPCSSPSMSINLDQSRDSLLDQSLCSNPTREEGGGRQPYGEEERTPRAVPEEGGRQTTMARAAGMQSTTTTTATAAMGSSRTTTTIGAKGSEKASSTTSSSAFGAEETEQREEDEEDEEPPFPLPPVRAQKQQDNLETRMAERHFNGFNGTRTTATAAIRSPLNGGLQRTEEKEQQQDSKEQQQKPAAGTGTGIGNFTSAGGGKPREVSTKSPSVTPLWGRNERLVSYIHGYGTLGAPKGGGGTEKERKERRTNGDGGIGTRRNGNEHQRKREKEREREWTVHPIALRDGDDRQTAGRERVIPIQRRDGLGAGWGREEQQQTGAGTAAGRRRTPLGDSCWWSNDQRAESPFMPPRAAADVLGARSPLSWAASLSQSREREEWTTTAGRSSWTTPGASRGGYNRTASAMSQHSSEMPYSIAGDRDPVPPQPLAGSLFQQQQSAKPSTPFDHSRDSSRDEFMSSAGLTADQPHFRQSRPPQHGLSNGVREIPIQRSASAFAPALMYAGIEPPPPLYTSTRPTIATGGGGGPSEYYRREVLTRTLITRSSEALSAPPPLGRASPPPLPPLDIGLGGIPPPPPLPRDEVTEEYWVRYSRNIEEEERRIREAQERRRREEEDRRRRTEEQRRRWELEETELLDRMRRERDKLEKELEAQMVDRERQEWERVARDRLDREEAERLRRKEWDRIEAERRAYEEAELEKRRQLEMLEKERLERERLESERLERERIERQRQELERERERMEQQRLEQERVERERLEIERLEIERIERIKREKREKENRERERQKQEAERLQREREELERLEKERLELERQARELLERERLEEAEREKERREEALREARRREEERRDRELLERAEREAAERELSRRARERAEQERLEQLQREQERLGHEEREAKRRERERLEEERREKELIEAAIRAKERRDQERREEEEKERQRQEEERRERERRERERIEALQRERERQAAEQAERDRLAHLEAAAVERRAQRAMEDQRQRERMELERRAEELKDMERREQERRERERVEEERRLAELRDLEQRNANQREKERQEAADREEKRRREGWRSRELLEELARERDTKAQWEAEKRRLLSEQEVQERKRQALTSKETLERLTRKPYYSRENLTSLGTAGGQSPEVTTKLERQVIERVNRTLWTDTELRPASTAVGNGAPSYYGGTGGLLPSSLMDSSAPYRAGGGAMPPLDEPGRERLYQSRPPEEAQDYWLRRGGSTRTSKYRQRIEKARREFLQGGGVEPPLPASLPPYDPISERFRKSTEELGHRQPAYRGPLLQKFNSGEFAHPPAPAEPMFGPTAGSHLPTGLGRSPYEQEDAHRYSPRHSRRDLVDQQMETSHTRSKSADYLIDPRRPREEQTIPENELQKSLVIGDHDLHYRKSTERMTHVPPAGAGDWYRRDYGGAIPSATAMPMGPPSAATSGVFSAGATSAATASGYRPSDLLLSSSRPWSYLPPPPPPVVDLTPGSPAVGGISFPAGMFDRYKEEIEDLRRSRSSLHQLGLQPAQQQEHTKGGSPQPSMAETSTTVTREYSREAFSKTEVSTLPLPQGAGHQQQPGYTVSTVPSEWRLMAPRERAHTRVVEVADTFVERPLAIAQPPLANRYGGRVTLEELLDAIFQATKATPETPPADPGHSEAQLQSRNNADGPGIFTSNQALMERLAQEPQLTDQLLKNEPLFVRCAHCQLVRSLPEARAHFCWCRHCYTYYCSRACRQRDWERHRDRCTFARINSLCKEVIMKVRRDPETQFHMSRVAREGFRREGRGSVNIRLISAYSAQLYLERGWTVFAQHDPNQLLFYYPIQALIDQRKEPSLIQLCRKYNSNEKFILSVSIIADIEQCPETPPPTEPGRKQVAASGKTAAAPAALQGPPVPSARRPSPMRQELRQNGGDSGFAYSTAVPTNV